MRSSRDGQTIIYMALIGAAALIFGPVIFQSCGAKKATPPPVPVAAPAQAPVVEPTATLTPPAIPAPALPPMTFPVAPASAPAPVAASADPRVSDGSDKGRPGQVFTPFVANTKGNGPAAMGVASVTAGQAGPPHQRPGFKVMDRDRQ